MISYHPFLASETDRLGKTITYVYNENGNKEDCEVSSENYANGDVIEYEYEDGELIKELRNGTETVTYTYAEGELSEKIDTEAGLRYAYTNGGQVEVYRISDNTLLICSMVV